MGKRLKELEVASPHELHIEAVADWPDTAERNIHTYLRGHAVRGEWFKDSQEAASVIAWMQDAKNGLLRLQFEISKITRPPVNKQPRQLSKAEMFLQDFEQGAS